MAGYVKVVQSGNSLEVYEYENETSKNLRLFRKRKVVYGDRKTRTFRPDNIRRKVKSFGRIVRSNLTGIDRPALLTLTMYEVVGIKRAYSLLSVFFQRLRVDYGGDIKYVAVPEFQKRGAVHFHVILWGISEKQINEERNCRYFQRNWQYGYCDCVLTDGSIKLVGYLTKYMQKSMYDKRLCGEKGYSTSRNVLRPLSFAFKSILAYTKVVWDLDLDIAIPLTEKYFEVKWLGKGRYRLFNLE